MNVNETITDEFINLDEKIDIENKKAKKLFEESKVVNSRIKGLMSEIKQLKESSTQLVEELRERENQIVQKVQDVYFPFINVLGNQIRNGCIDSQTVGTPSAANPNGDCQFCFQYSFRTE